MVSWNTRRPVRKEIFIKFVNVLRWSRADLFHQFHPNRTKKCGQYG
jgi:hypothetical protein